MAGRLLHWILSASLGVTFILSGAVVAADGPGDSEDQDQVCTTDHLHCVKLVHRRLPNAPENEDLTLQVIAKGRVLASYPTFGSMHGFWSPDNRYVAIVNRRANGGDYLWILSGTDGKALKVPQDLAEALKRPELGQVQKGHSIQEDVAEALSICSECKKEDWKNQWLFATAWKSPTELEVVDEISFRNVEDRVDFRSVYRVEGDHVTVVSRRGERRKEADFLWD